MWLAGQVSTIAKSASWLGLASSYWPKIHVSFLFTVVHNVFVYNYCVCGGCTNTSLPFPQQEEVQVFVRVKRQDVMKNGAVVCKALLKPEDYLPAICVRIIYNVPHLKTSISLHIVFGRRPAGFRQTL